MWGAVDSGEGGVPSAASAVIESFQFNFDIPGEDSQPPPAPHGDDDHPMHIPATPSPDLTHLLPGEVIDPFPLLSQPTTSPGVPLPLLPSFAPLRPPAPPPSTLPSSHPSLTSDVIPHLYEGGFKVWDCAIDLLRFLSSHPLSLSPSPTSRSCLSPVPSPFVTLELGCGVGLPSLYLLLTYPAVHCTLQDLNREVLTHSTMPTFRLNLTPTPTPSSSSPSPSHPLLTRCRFLSGDWSSPSLLPLLFPRCYQLILTSDTLYNPTSIPPLLHLIAHSLSPTGRVLVGSQRFYFGVGGGSGELMRQVHADGRFECEVVSSVEDGRSTIRDVIEMRWKGGKLG